MTTSESHATNPSDYEPDFVLARFDVIHEDNWPEYAARGFTWLHNVSQEEWDERTSGGRLPQRYSTWEKGNTYSGDAWDQRAGKPLRHKPGVGLYYKTQSDDPAAS